MQKRTMNDGLNLRLPDGWRDRIKASAARNRRSMNSEVLSHLEGAFGAAAGEDFGRNAPAAGSDNAALAGGASITQGIGGAANE